MKNNSAKFHELRKKHKKLIYHDFSITEGKITFHFSIEGSSPDNSFQFKPEWRFDGNLPLQGNIDLLAFNLGMAELISYWKCACPEMVEIRCGNLDEWQINWWKKLYRNGLGEFFYINGIKAGDNFMQIYANGAKLPPLQSRELLGCLIPVGGGKDSIVTLELIREQRQFNSCFVVGDIKRAIDSAKMAGYPNSRIIKVSRTIDPTLLELNKQGYLNGHTPFSSIIAFSSLLFGYMAGKKYIVLSNESSANEGNTADGVNHQYSKSVEFERDFREYVYGMGENLPQYFSLLRAYSELKITELFIRHRNYFPIFQSCNVGTKTNTWCCKCAKCLYIYIMLAAFLDDNVLISIFGENLLENKELALLLAALANPDYDKPFECVGTRDEVNFALYKALCRRSAPPELLRGYADKIKLPDVDILNSFDENNFVPEEFLRLLK
ncbi:MAG: hypothetical protein FWH08_06170 [Oscillospiraceae bacterium]|nr:hypothetical protein [Oscillospiraceae bacterium]